MRSEIKSKQRKIYLNSLFLCFIGVAFIVAPILMASNSWKSNAQGFSGSDFSNTNSNEPEPLKQVPLMIKNYKNLGGMFEQSNLFESETKKAEDNVQLQKVVEEGLILNLNTTFARRTRRNY
jgi:hypothetical protein